MTTELTLPELAEVGRNFAPNLAMPSGRSPVADEPIVDVVVIGKFSEPLTSCVNVRSAFI
jgi:hypothetical protein